MAPVLEIWKMRYCNSDTRHLTCARFKLSLQKRPVAPNLLPNGELMQVAGIANDPTGGSCGP